MWGRVTVAAREEDRAFGMTLRDDGNIVLASGCAVFGPDPKFALARYQGS
jgi:hypothetical protein